MMKQDVLLTNTFQQIRHFRRQAQGLREVNGVNLRSGRGVWSASENRRDRFTGPLVLNTCQGCNPN